MKRTKLADRILPVYSPAEETMNMVTHIIGGILGVLALTFCVIRAASHGSAPGVIASSIYGASMILLYTMSSVYHGLRPGMGKKVMQVMDHCTIYFLIGGTYTPIVLGPIRELSPGWGWTIFGIVWGCAALGTVFTAIDLKKYAKLSMICYLGMGWCIVIAAKITIEALSLPAFLWILAGGIAYTIGAVLYGLGRKRRYMHSVFHIFVLLGSIVQYLGIILYIL